MLTIPSKTGAMRSNPTSGYAAGIIFGTVPKPMMSSNINNKCIHQQTVKLINVERILNAWKRGQPQPKDDRDRH